MRAPQRPRTGYSRMGLCLPAFRASDDEQPLWFDPIDRLACEFVMAAETRAGSDETRGSSGVGLVAWRRRLGRTVSRVVAIHETPTVRRFKAVRAPRHALPIATAATKNAPAAGRILSATRSTTSIKVGNGGVGKCTDMSFPIKRSNHPSKMTPATSKDGLEGGERDGDRTWDQHPDDASCKQAERDLAPDLQGEEPGTRGNRGVDHARRDREHGGEKGNGGRDSHRSSRPL